MVDGDPPPGVDGASHPGGLDVAPSGLKTPSGILDAQPDSVAAAPNGLAAQAEGADGLAQPAVEANIGTLALVIDLLPTISHPAIEYNVPVLEVERYIIYYIFYFVYYQYNSIM